MSESQALRKVIAEDLSELSYERLAQLATSISHLRSEEFSKIREALESWSTNFPVVWQMSALFATKSVEPGLI